MLYLKVAQPIRCLNKEENKIHHRLDFAWVKKPVAEEGMMDLMKVDLVFDIGLLRLKFIQLSFHLQRDLVQCVRLTDILSDRRQEGDIDVMKLEKWMVRKVNIANVF